MTILVYYGKTRLPTALDRDVTEKTGTAANALIWLVSLSIIFFYMDVILFFHQSPNKSKQVSPTRSEALYHKRLTTLHSSRMRIDRISQHALRWGEGAWSRRGCLLRGGDVLGCVCFGGGVGAWSGGWYPCMHWGRPPPWTESHTHLWKHYLAPTSLRAVMMVLIFRNISVRMGQLQLR